MKHRGRRGLDDYQCFRFMFTKQQGLNNLTFVNDFTKKNKNFLENVRRTTGSTIFTVCSTELERKKHKKQISPNRFLKL